MSKKKVVKPRVARTMNHFTMTPSGFFGFLRSRLRKMSIAWIPIRECKKNVRIPYVGDNKRMKWLYVCEKCKEAVPEKCCAVHHLESCGQLKSFEDLPGFCKRLFCEIEGLILLCDSCHTKEHEKEI